MPKIHEMPDPRTRARRIVSVSRTSSGWSVEFECRHVVWFPVDVTGWPSAYCGGCLDQLTQEARILLMKGKIPDAR